jgi:hypothetical protein
MSAATSVARPKRFDGARLVGHLRRKIERIEQQAMAKHLRRLCLPQPVARDGLAHAVALLGTASGYRRPAPPAGRRHRHHAYLDPSAAPSLRRSGRAALRHAPAPSRRRWHPARRPCARRPLVTLCARGFRHRSAGRAVVRAKLRHVGAGQSESSGASTTNTARIAGVAHNVDKACRIIGTPASGRYCLGSARPDSVAPCASPNRRREPVRDKLMSRFYTIA